MPPRQSYMHMPLSFNDQTNENIQYPMFQRMENPRPVEHGLHFFCKRCFGRIWLGETSFKLYLLLAWCLGLAAIMLSQHKNVVFSICAMVYLLAQVFGLLGTISHVRKIFIPYFFVVCFTICTSFFFLLHFIIKCLSFREYEKKTRVIGIINVIDSLLFPHPFFSAVFTFFFLIYNTLCFLSVIYQCEKFQRQRVRTEQRRRELLVRNAMIYDRLIALNTREAANNQQLVVTNPDSPPKYSSLDSKSNLFESPPPKYSTIQMFNDKTEEK